ncbi:telomere-protecting terminal protein Tpg [Streptomyces microflavus]|uniref:telomere-protecting terminal protein Tpg n=1 Tax=Streptomyces microflavus TaxID=1919 RepID=UPI0036EEF1E7
MSLIGDGLNKAVQKAFTRPAPKSAGAQMRYLVKQLGGTKAVAQMLRVSQRTVERYVKNQIKAPRPGLAARLDREVKQRWQPQIRAKAKQKAASTGGIIIDTRARLFNAQEAGASDARLQQIAAEAPKEVYFQDSGRRAGSLDEVRFTDIEHLEFDL